MVDCTAASVHAEVQAIRQIKHMPRNATIYVARVNKQGQSRLARPCVNCMKEIIGAGIRTIVYTNEFGTYSIERVK